MYKKILLDAKPSMIDERDYHYSQKKNKLKTFVDLREWDSPVDDQLSIGSCVGNAIANAYELMVKKLYPDSFVELSRLFIYYNSRLFDNSYKEDIGTYIRDGIKSVAKYGVCEERLWPYIEEKFDDQPDPECYADASLRLITRYESLYTLRDMLETLDNEQPIVAGITVYEDFMFITRKNPIVELPKNNDKSHGSHAVTLLGYDLSKQLFIAKNSFGQDWGSNGYFYIPFEYIRTESFEKWCFDINTQKSVPSVLYNTKNIEKSRPKNLYKI